MKSPSISVIYLCWLPYGLHCLNDFINAYQKYDAGITHNLVIIFKGNKQPNETEPFIAFLHHHHVSFQQLTYTGNGLDISTYYWAAQQLDCEDILFLNTRSRILTPNWLYHFYTSSKAEPTTICSATGSWQSYSSSVFTLHTFAYERSKSFKVNINKYKLLIKAATLWWYYFPLFPNPHIRTNAFFIDRQLFLSLRIGNIKTKINAYRFESGREGFTRQLKNKGYNMALLAKDGKMYPEKEWHLSNIFWMADQENLMIGDNQTEIYLNSDLQNKTLLERLAWGQNLLP